MRKIVLVLHALKNIKNVKLEHKFLHPKNRRNRPYVNFTFAKSDVLVPILHMVFAFQQRFVHCLVLLVKSCLFCLTYSCLYMCSVFRPPDKSE